ncbi:MAG: hypothetical protein KBC81_01450 [Candidatus Pacebacteria bacterium]|nr:hypothetical protein [Candidatus Paceibacterota bacterium]
MKFVSEYRRFLVLPALVVLGLFLSVYSRAATTTGDSQQIQSIQQQIDEYQKQIDVIHSQTVSLQGQISGLNAQINQTTLVLKSLALLIAQTNRSIQETQAKISEAESQISKNQVVLAQYLQLVYKSDQESLTGILLKNNNLSDFFGDLNNIKTNQDNLKNIMDSIRSLKVSLDMVKQELENKQQELEKQQGLAAIDKRNLDQNKAQKDKLLKTTKIQEKTVQQKIDTLKQEISYLLQNGVTVEDAIKYGNLAAIATGIRPAFLLAEMDHESAVLNPGGGNVGKCYVTNFDNGDGVHIDTGAPTKRNMNPTRDIKPFLAITSSLGLNPSTTRVSCWPKTYSGGQPYGWGGAMGPAQFIASTWMGYKDKVSQITGHNPANPWNIQDAFTAAATKFAKDGASSKDRAGEIAASKRYYCGSATSTNKACINYANAVQNLAAQIQQSL